MPQLLCCPRGHRWPSGASSGPAVCPVCGAGDATLVGDAADNHSATLAAPAWRPAAPSDGGDTLGQTGAPDAESLAPTLMRPPAAPPAAPSDTLAGDAAGAPWRPGVEATERPSADGGSDDKSPTLVRPDGTRGRPDADFTQLAASAAQSPEVGPAIPGYRILGELGRGGMGVVYKAEQIGLNRLVALKMILSGAFADREDLARFRLEAEASARLQHPGIVQVYEIGEAAGKPFFCLEFVDGGPLDKRLAGNPQPFRQAAALAEKLARAMDYAHRRHIIHRDLKPPNVLLTADGEPKIADFGLAKRLDSMDSQTQTGSVMGTPNYMAPEQAQGRTRDIGPAADVWSLGAILYETLTGRPPFKGEAVVDTLDMVRSQEAVPPSRLRPKLPRDLETICLKCLQKEPGKRYGTAGALAEDLRRWQAGEPILARPTPTWERAWKWARRRPALATLAGVVVLFVLVLIGGGAAWAVEETHLRWVADRERDQARDARVLADKRFVSAQQAVRDLLTKVGQERLAHEPHMEKVRRELLTDALEFNKQFLQEKSDDPAVRWETGRAYVMDGDIHGMLGDQDAAEQSYGSAAEVLASLRGQFPGDARYRRDLAKCRNNHGKLLLDADRTPEAETAFGEADALLQKLVDESDLPEDQTAEAQVADNLGVLLMGEGRYAEAESLLRKSLGLRERLAGVSPVADAPGSPAAVLDLAHGRHDLSLLLAAVGRADEADKLLREANVQLSQLMADHPDEPDYRLELAVSHRNLGDLWRDTKPALADREYEDSRLYCGQLAADFPAAPVYRQRLAEACHNLGFVRQAAGRQADAESSYDEAQKIEEKLAADYPAVPEYKDDLAKGYNIRGILLQTTNRLPDAEKLYGKALALLEPLVKEHPDSPIYKQDKADVLQNLGVVYQATNRPDDAGKALDRSLDLRRKLAAEHPRAPDYQRSLGEAKLNVGAAWQLNGKAPEAEASYREAADLFARLTEQYPMVPDYRHLLAVAENDLGNLLRATNHNEDAEKAWKQAADLLSALKDQAPTVPSYRQNLARCLNELAMLLATTDRAAEADKVWTRVLELQEKLAGDFPKNPVYREEWAKYVGNVGVLRASAGRLNQAEESYQRAVDLLESLTAADPDNPLYWRDLVPAYTNLVGMLKLEDAPRERTAKGWARLAELWRKLAGVERAPADWKQAVQCLRNAFDLVPDSASYRSLLCEDYLSLAQALFDGNDRAGAADAVAALLKAAPNGWPTEAKNAERLKTIQDKLK